MTEVTKSIFEQAVEHAMEIMAYEELSKKDACSLVWHEEIGEQLCGYYEQGVVIADAIAVAIDRKYGA